MTKYIAHWGNGYDDYFEFIEAKDVSEAKTILGALMKRQYEIECGIPEDAEPYIEFICTVDEMDFTTMTDLEKLREKEGNIW